jgi:hypothetical protein
MSAAKLGAVAVLVVVGSLSAAATRLLSRQKQPVPVAISIEGRAARVPAGTTLSQAAATFALHPRGGELLDLASKPLRADGEPGRLLVDGRVESGGTPLRTGERITVKNGSNRREGLTRQVLPLPGGELGDPLFTLSAARSRMSSSRAACGQPARRATREPWR